METFTVFLIPALLAVVGLRLLMAPIRLALKLLIHAGGGLICLILLNSIAGFTGILFPINVLTILIAGIIGIPGIAILALVQLMA